MACRVELPKEIIVAALEQAAGLRARNAKAATNKIIQQALEEELRQITAAKTMVQEIPEPRK